MRRQSFVFTGVFQNGASFRSEAWNARVYVLEQAVFKVLLYREEGDLTPSLSVAWQGGDCDANPRNRLEPKGFSFPRFSCELGENAVALATDSLKAVVLLPEFRIVWFISDGGAWLPLFCDRETQSYNFDGLLGRGAFHYVARERTDLHFGLGERTGSVIKTQGFYRMRNVDCMGYDASCSDPLYKHFPYYLVQAKNGCYALYYDTPAECELDLGSEIDNYHGLYQYIRTDARYLDYYVFGAKSMKEIVPDFARLGGTPCFPPIWSLGYLASSMAYADAVNAQAMLLKFLERCREEDIPLSGFHLSSGYTAIGENRYVFHWNSDRFPAPKELFERYAENGVHVLANVKPCLLTDHPLYAECAKKGLFIRSESGEPQLSQFWGALGSYLDFTNPAAQLWWEQKVKEQLLSCGIEATWNDNNEFEIWDERALCFGMGSEHAAYMLRPDMTLEMLRASMRAQRSYAPEKRPLLISRSGCLGMQRYAQTWTGDNYTDWKTLRYNHKMGLGMSLSGIFNFGHDVGGFAGPKPEPELLVRWVQHGVFMPRFSIHSWNDDGSANEPWMYPECTAHIRKLLLLRYRILPYLYTLLYRSHTEYAPIVCPVFYHFPKNAAYESDLYMLGEDLLVANVFDKGVSELTVTLPEGCGWYGLWDDALHAGGETLRLDASLSAPPPVFMRAGSLLPLDPCVRGFSKRLPLERVCRLYLPESGSFTKSFFMDDGETYAYQSGGFSLPTFEVCAQKEVVRIRFDDRGGVPLGCPLSLEVTDALHRRVALSCLNGTCTLKPAGDRLAVW